MLRERRARYGTRANERTLTALDPRTNTARHRTAPHGTARHCTTPHGCFVRKMTGCAYWHLLGRSRLQLPLGVLRTGRRAGAMKPVHRAGQCGWCSSSKELLGLVLPAQARCISTSPQLPVVGISPTLPKVNVKMAHLAYHKLRHNSGSVGKVHCFKAPPCGRFLYLGALGPTQRFAHWPLLLLKLTTAR